MEDDWIEWSGGVQPVPRDQYVEVRFKCGPVGLDNADAFDWHHINDGSDIIAYRIKEQNNEN